MLPTLTWNSVFSEWMAPYSLMTPLQRTQQTPSSSDSNHRSSPTVASLHDCPDRLERKMGNVWRVKVGRTHKHTFLSFLCVCNETSQLCWGSFACLPHYCSLKHCSTIPMLHENSLAKDEIHWSISLPCSRNEWLMHYIIPQSSLCPSSLVASPHCSISSFFPHKWKIHQREMSCCSFDLLQLEKKWCREKKTGLYECICSIT